MAERDNDPDAGTATFEDWRRLVEASLKGGGFSTLQTRTRDGIVLDPLYRRAHAAAPLPGRGGAPWLVVQNIDHPDPDAANLQALEDVKGGATGLALGFAANAGSGLPPTKQALHAVLDGVDIAAVQIRLEPGLAVVEAAGWLRELIALRGIAPERAKALFGLDLIGCGAETESLKQRVACFAELQAGGYSGPFADLDSRPVHEAGGSEAQELASILASAVWWLRALEQVGIDPETALPLFGASMSVDRDQWLSVAKLRALRLLWARLLELCRAQPFRLPIHAETSRRMMTRTDPHGNILRATIGAFAAGIGGADSIAVLPFTAALGHPDNHARAIARNIHYLLLEESQIHRVADPAAGSGAVEALTAALIESAWVEFQALEREGGLADSLRAGAFQARIAAACEALRVDLANGKGPLVGSTLYREAGVEPERDLGGPMPAGELSPIRLEELARGPAS